MAALVYLFSLIYLALIDTAGLTFQQETDLYLNITLNVNQWLFWLLLGIMIAIFLAGLIFTLVLICLGNKKYVLDRLSLGLSCSSCAALSIVFLPAAQGLIFWGNHLMANAYSGGGIIDPFKFWFGFAITILTIWG